ncbi:uncharacterized protein [Aquarana catesbeiana]|uniref:uncharacterized protein n=1 Tax=Aquarana catesbeiana TaxID=8400 RepID=UPI003CCA2D4D
MASANLRAELECFVCLNIYTDPVMLRCGHNFCRVCIDRVLDTQEGSGGYFCPECREKFQDRPALQRNITLRNIVENLLSAQPDQEESGVFCTYCVDSPVPAVRSCLLCEVSLCDKHLRAHKKSPEHVLCDPTLSMESRKCSVHKKILEYYCTEDNTCACMLCVTGKHKGHEMESLAEASEMKKETLRNVLQNLLIKREETKERVQSLQEHRRKVEEKTAGDTERVTALFRDLRRRLEDLEKRVLREISGRAEQISISIRDLEIKKEELSRKMRHIEELCNMTDPLTVLQESDTGDLCDTEDGDNEDRERREELLHDGEDKDVDGISHTLHTLSDIITEVNVYFYIQEPADILLDVNTAHNLLHISNYRKTVSNAYSNQNRPVTPERFQYCGQVLSSQSFSSGRHYWEVEVGGSDWWGVGMCYPSIDRRGEQSVIGRNSKSWGLYREGDQYEVMHDRKKIFFPTNISSNRVRIYLDYEAGRISFYDLCDPIRHLHTFTTTFTEPLHAGIWVGKGCIKVVEGIRRWENSAQRLGRSQEKGGWNWWINYILGNYSWLKSASGSTITDPDQVAEEFRTFYSDLYSSTTHYSQDELITFLQTITFPTLTSSQVEQLEAPITTECIAEALAQLPASKAPGSDGLPLEFYKQFSETLIPKLCKLYTHIFDTKGLPPSMNEPPIVLIPKPGKDPLFPESYRPISLLQLDVKILAKILALRLNKVITGLIHPDQTGFMPGKNTAFNLRRLYMNLQSQHTEVGSRVVVSLDAAKAFDSVEWRYLWECLHRDFYCHFSLLLSAMASGDLRAELECSVCLNIYTDPEKLKCGHNFCRVCIDRVLDTQEGSGGYSCPECREKFQDRRALHRNITLRNIVENFLSAQPDREESGVFCTYCVGSPIPAVRSCLHCEVSLCDKHLRAHKKSPEHVLCDPTLSMESRKCSVHKKILEYYCTEDDTCICVSCTLAGEHRGHQVEMLDEASEKKKETLRNVLQNLLIKREEMEERVQSLQEHRRKVEEKVAGDTEKVTVLFRDLRRHLEDLEKRILREISERAEGISIRDLEIKKEELSRKMRHIEELCNMTDPLTVLQESDTGDLCDTEDGDNEDRERHEKLLHDGGGLDVDGISHTLHTLSDIITEVNVSFYIQEAAAILLDVNTAHNNLHISDDRKTVSRSDIDQNRPETPERCLGYPQVLSSRSFSSGRHYWEVDVGGSDRWIVGMCYPSIERGGVQSLIGDNRKSWGLYRIDDQYGVRHDCELIPLPPNISSNRVRIDLDYEVGRISFYDLCDPIQHLHTFTTTFTEPLHAGICVVGGRIKVCGGN